MKFILTKDVSGLGRAGDVKEVSDGHARNFLLPRRLALPATSSALSKLQKEEAEKQAKAAKDHERGLELKKKLDGKTIVIKGKAQGLNLFASLHEKDIALAISQKTGAEISPDMISLPKALKSLGSHDVEIALAKDIKATVKLTIEAI